MPFSEIKLDDREIIPISNLNFGVVVGEKELSLLHLGGFHVRTTPPAKDQEIKHYIEVWLGAHQRQAGLELPGPEWKGRADLVIAPIPWRGKDKKHSGIKFYIVSVKESKCIT